MKLSISLIGLIVSALTSVGVQISFNTAIQRTQPILRNLILLIPTSVVALVKLSGALPLSIENKQDPSNIYLDIEDLLYEDDMKSKMLNHFYTTNSVMATSLAAFELNLKNPAVDSSTLENEHILNNNHYSTSINSNFINMPQYDAEYNMQYAPILVKPVESVVSIEENVASFFCEAIANPKPQFRWVTRQGKRVTGRRYTEINMKDRMGSILRIEPLKSEKDNGVEFTCEANNGVSPPATQSANLTVLSGKQIPPGFPRIIQGASSKVIEKGTIFSLPCEAIGDPPITILWLKDYTPLDLSANNRYRLFEDGRLQIDVAEENDYGEYQCIASNKWGSVYSPTLAKIWVKVRRVPPHFSILPPTSLEIARGTNITKITCVAVGSPMPYVRWKKLTSQKDGNNWETLIRDYGEDEEDLEDQDASVEGTAPIGKNVLVLRNARDDANYSCIAASELGMIETKTMVIVKDLPPAPSAIHIEDLTSRSVKMTWTSPYNPHPNQPYTYVIELKTSGMNDDDNKKQWNLVNVSATNIELNHLKPDTSYVGRMRIRTSVGLSPPSQYVSFKTLEAAPATSPQIIGTKAINSKEILLRWTEPQITNGKIKSYKLYYNGDNKLPLSLWPSLEVNSQDTEPQQSLILPNLQPNTIYAIRIAALNNKGISPLSDPLKFYTQLGVPSQIPNFKGFVTSPYSVRLTWAKNLDWDIIDAYLIHYQDTKHGTQNTIQINNPNITTYNFNNLNADTLYHFKMTPRSGKNDGISTPTIALITQSTIPIIKTSLIKMEASKHTSTSITVSVYQKAESDSNEESSYVDGYKLFWEEFKSSDYNRNSSGTISNTNKNFAYFPNVEQIKKSKVFNSSSSYVEMFSHFINELKPWTTYKIWLTPVLGGDINGDGPPYISIYAKTLEDVPGEPKNLSLKPINSTAIALMWEPPDESQRNGEIMGYLIHFREVISKGKAVGSFQQLTIPDGTITQMILNDLKPESYYKVQVSAFTRKGDGYRSKAKVTRTMGGVPSAPSLLLRLLEEYPQLLVQAEWTRPATTYGQLTGYKLTYKHLDDDDDGIIKRTEDRKGTLNKTHVVELPGGNIYYYNVENLGRGRTYEFQLSARNERGYGQSFVKIFETPDGVPINAPINFTYKFQTPTTIKFAWTLSDDTATLNGPIVLYEILYYQEGMSEDPYIYNTTSAHFAVRELKLGNVYYFKVRSYTRKGSGPWTDPIILHLGDKASPAVNRVRAYAISKTAISLYWDQAAPYLSEENHVKKYQIFYTSKVDQDYDHWQSLDMIPYPTTHTAANSNGSNNTKISIPIPENSLKIDIKDLESGVIYAFQVASVTDRGLGVLSSPITTILTEPLIVPRELIVLGVTTNSLRIAWEAPIDIRPQSYEVSMRGYKNYTDDKGKGQAPFLPPLNFTIAINPSPSAGITFKNLLPHTKYVMEIRTIFSLGNQGSLSDKMSSLMEDKPAAKLSTLTDYDAPPPFEWSPMVVESPTVADGIAMIKLPLASGQNGPISHYLLVVIPQVKFINKGGGTRPGRSAPSTTSFTDIYSMDELIYANGYDDIESPYVAAMFPAKEFPAKGIFGLGDDKYYHTFHNRPLSPGKLYRVFLRVFAGHFDQKLLHNEGNTSTHFHSKYPKYTSSRLSESFGLPLQTDLASSYNLLTSQYGEGPFLSLPDRNNGRERIKLAKNKKIAQLSWPLKSLSLLIIALSIVISLLILALLCYFFIFHKRRKSTKRAMLANKGLDEKLNDDMDTDGAEKKKLLVKPSKHHETSVIFSNAYNSVHTDCYQDQNYAPLSPYDETEENDTVIFNDKINSGVIFKNGSLLSAMSKKSSQDRQQHSQYNTKSLTRRGKVSAASISSTNAKMKDYASINLANLPPDPVSSRRFNYRTTAMSTHPPLTLKELPEYITKLKANDNAYFSQEYERKFYQSIDPGQVFTWEHSSKESNKCRNRYANVVAYDHTRVILSSPDNFSNNEYDDSITNDYINANYIDGYRKPGAYIATQGPLPETVEDFWRMIWEQNTCIIVMLTKLEERARIKCDQYWPSRGTTEFYGKELQNTMLDSVELATYTIRTFSLNKVGTNETREVKQYQFTAWPDHGVPDYPTPFLYFLRRVKAANPPNAGPLVVHCSAGVGRTGTFIVIDSMIERMKIEDTVDVYGHVTLMRAQRNFMVQTEEQYIFIYDSILEAYECGDTEVPAIELSSQLQRLNNIIPGETMSGMEMEFKKLCNQKVSPAKFVSANYSVNKYKNRLVNILPFESNRVCLFPVRGVEGSDYINASFIDGYRTKNAYIATQGPLAETIEDFWRMLWEHNSNIIVMLTKLRENGREKSVQYWPIDCSVRYGRFVIEPVAEYTMPQYTLREFKVTDVKGSMSSKGTALNYHPSENIELQPYTTNTTLNAMGILDDSCYGSLGTAPASLHPGMRCVPITSSIQQPLSTAITTTRTIRQFQFDYPIEEEFIGLESNSGTGLRRVSKQNENVGSNFLSCSTTSTVPRPSTRPTLTSSPTMSERKNITLKLQTDEGSFSHIHDSSFFSSTAHGITTNPLLSHSTTADCLGNNGLEEVFVDFIGQVHKTKEQFGLNGPITVHCGAGVGRTGVFIACSIALERMKFEGYLDLFQTIRALRTQRLGMVQTESQYKFCYRAALQYLRSFDMYTS